MSNPPSISFRITTMESIRFVKFIDGQRRSNLLGSAVGLARGLVSVFSSYSFKPRMKYGKACRHKSGGQACQGLLNLHYLTNTTSMVLLLLVN